MRRGEHGGRARDGLIRREDRELEVWEARLIVALPRSLPDDVGRSLSRPLPKPLSRMSDSELDAWAGNVVEASKAALRTSGETFPGDEA